MPYRLSCIILFLFSFIEGVNAQGYKKFKVGLGLGRNMSRLNSSMLFIEPTYLITPKFSIGCRFEFIKTYVDIHSISNSQGTLSSSDVLSYTLNTQYYFRSDKKIRPYVGLGAGVWVMYIDDGTYVTNGKTTKVKSGSFLHYATKPGIYTSLGFDWWHLNVAVEYNLVPTTKIETVNSAPNQLNEIKNSYLFLKVGLFIGGGRKPQRIKSEV